jgi:hypothetical protein
MAHCPVCARERSSGVDSCPEHAEAGASETPTLEARRRPAEPLSQQRPRGRFVPGTLLGGRYRVVALLGAGGMGEVYRADDLRLGQTVALKLLPPDVAGDPARLARFRDEVRLAREVTHPGVCRVHDLGEAEGLTFLTMEFVDGEDLASLLRRIGRLPLQARRSMSAARRGWCSGTPAADPGRVSWLGGSSSCCWSGCCRRSGRCVWRCGRRLRCWRRSDSRNG